MTKSQDSRGLGAREPCVFGLEDYDQSNNAGRDELSKHPVEVGSHEVIHSRTRRTRARDP